MTKKSYSERKQLISDQCPQALTRWLAMRFLGGNAFE